MREQYQPLTEAASIIASARLEVYKVEGPSPAWDKLRRAGEYLDKQAKAILDEGREAANG